MKHQNTHSLLRYVARNLLVVIGIVLVWRGVWHLLDALDAWLFGKSHLITAVGGIIFGLVLLFIPDGDLKELDKM